MTDQAQEDKPGDKQMSKQDIKKELARFILQQVKEQRLPKEQALGFLQELSKPVAEQTSTTAPAEDIAIIGVACRFPQAPNKEAFWQNLLAGQSCIGPFPANRRDDLAALDDYATELFHGGFLQHVDHFDNEYFGIAPIVARHMDPYQRLMLEVLVETIEDAGYHRGALYGKQVGVFIGNDHTHRLFNSYVSFIDEIDFNSVTGSWTAVLASRISYLFNFKGPAVVLDTACSSALVALDQAIKALRDGDCESALVGAANLFFAPGKGLVGEIENTDYKVRAFDKGASGTVWGEGVAAVMLKPLSLAERDGDAIAAVIKGVAVNNDGASNGLTAPNAKAQQEVILKAWEKAGVKPEQVSYIETHGTGTHLGDPIEIKGLIGAFGKTSQRKQFCGIGSVKTNIGHTVGVAGMASLIKVMLSMQQKTLPASLHFEQPNPFIDFCNSPVYVNDRQQAWQVENGPRIAGVSSFSLSGTNCHLVVQEYIAAAEPAVKAGWRLFTVSARNLELLKESIARYLRYLTQLEQSVPDQNSLLARLCYTAALGRESHPLRACLLVDSLASLQQGLQEIAASLQSSASLAYVQQPIANSAGQWCLQAEHIEQSDAAASSAARRARDNALPAARAGEGNALLELARLYVQGTPIKWELLYQEEKLRKLNLPAQPFMQRRFWDKAPGQPKQKQSSAAAAEASSMPAAHAAQAKRDEVLDRTQLLASLALAEQSAPRLLGLDSLDEQDSLPYRVLAYIWSEVLGYSQLRLQDDFYALGGDSISGMKIVHVLNAVFHMQLSLADLLSADNLREFVGKLLHEHQFALALHGEQTEADASLAITPLPSAPDYALSRAQMRMLLLENMSPGSTAYNVNAVLQLRQMPDLAQVQQIMQQIIARHESLRSSFVLAEGQMRQIVRDEVAFAPQQIALADTSPECLQLAIKEFIQPFDLSAAPLLRLGFFSAGAGSPCHMVIDMHHIITDGSSMGVLVAEFLALQNGESLPALPFQYKDFAAWQNQQFASARYQTQEQFWLAQFADGAPVLELQADFPRPAYQDFVGVKQHFLIDKAVQQQLQEVAKAQGCTLFILLLAAFDALLYRLGAGNDLALGSPVAGRNRHDLQGLIGMFVNTLVLRNQVAAGDSFADLLAKVRSNTLAALANQDYPYEELVEKLGLPRNAGRNPLFDIYFVLQNADMGLASEADNEQGNAVLAQQLEHFDSGSAKFDMTVVLRVTNEGLHLDWEYATSLYSASTIARMAAQFQTLLQQICAAASESNGLSQLLLAKLDVLSPVESAWLRDGVNATDSAYPAAQSLSQIFSAQAARTPHAIALDTGTAQCSYAELEQQSNRLAQYLLSLGVQPGQLLGLQCEPGIAMIAAMLAVFKVGAAYVPLELDIPMERTQSILQEADCKLLLCEAGLPRPFEASQLPHLQVIELDGLDLSALPFAHNPEHALDLTSGAAGERLAYVIFTSGSTGKPKGTLIRHKSAIRVVCNTNYITLSSSDCLLHSASYAFDGSIFNIWAALLHGGRLRLLARHSLIDMDALSNIIVQSGVTVFFMTTALFNALLDTRPAALNKLRHLLVGGEGASLKHMRQAAQILGPGGLIHVYGPTETTVFATAYPIHDSSFARQCVPIGSPLSNTSCYVLNEHMQLQGIGVAGQLYIGGDGLALGYLHRPELTAEKFVDHPFVAGEKLYASGDIVKWLDDGQLQFLGRIDHQVKIRGYRIELGEIEAVLAKHPQVKECLIVVNQDSQGAKQLWAYVVAQPAPQSMPQSMPQPADSEDQQRQLSSALRAFLAANLPEYMLPAAIICLSAFVLNTNGKVDRTRLPAPSQQHREQAAVAPRNAEETQLVKVWQELLNVSELGIYDNFFALGGDSIKAIQIVARMQEQGYALAMPQLFQYQSIAELAPHLRAVAAGAEVAQFATREIAKDELDNIFSDLNLL